ncbi:MAG: MBL fold metallo-hydrolase [Candidatus Lokiarchaeota archaeon]|nr:MBL fold metallo-hydrolase [Candidatus Lokiarchaeota archaeon]
MFLSGGTSTKRGKEVLNNLYYFSEHQMLDCNQYLIHDPDLGEFALFDAGNGVSLNGLFDGMKKLGFDYRNITKVILTHEHVDHVLGIYPLMKKLKDDPPEIYAYGETAKIIKEGDESKIFPGNLGISPSMFGINIIPLNVQDIQDNKKIEIFPKFSFEIYYTPGHSLGSVSYYEPQKKILIPGDLVFAGGSFGRYDFPGGSLSTLQTSIGFVNDLDVKYLLPGHMNISENGNQQISLSYRMVKSIGSYF